MTTPPSSQQSTGSPLVPPRFVRQPGYASFASKDHFVPRSRARFPLLLHARLDALLSWLNIRRTKRTRSLAAFTALSLLVVLLLVTTSRVAHPRALARLAVPPPPRFQTGLDAPPTDPVPVGAPLGDGDAAGFAPAMGRDQLPGGEPPGSRDDVLSPDAQKLDVVDVVPIKPIVKRDGADGVLGRPVAVADQKRTDAAGKKPADAADQKPPAVAVQKPRPPQAEPAEKPITGGPPSTLRASDDADSAPAADAPLQKPSHSDFTQGNMSIVVLFHNEFDSLNTALSSWLRNGLIDYVDEIIFFLNGASDLGFATRVNDFFKIPGWKRRIEPSKENLALGLAITRMVELAKSEYVLLLEKDWELIENADVMRSRLKDSKVLVGSGVADVVRHRHRHNPGVPLHALIMHQGREESIMRVQKNMLCFVHHWQQDPTVSYPGQGVMWRCGGKQNGVEETDVFCSTSVYCQWTNNPAVFKRKWFLDGVGYEFRKQHAIELKQHGSTSPFLDFEYYTNWRPYAWADKNFTVAVGTGLFSHAETEHRHFNTFWYAHYRLTVDEEEIRQMYLANETRFKQAGGVHFDPNYTKPLSMLERYPVDFVRKFHWKDTFTGDLATQRAAIDQAYQPYVKMYRVDAKEWDSQSSSALRKAALTVGWRHYITNLHHAVEKAMMLAPPVQPFEMNITLVTVLLDLGRDKLEEDGYKFRRDFQMYLDALKTWLTHKYPKVVYTSKDIADEVMKDASEEVKQTTKFVYTSKEELRTKWIGPDNYAKVQEIRTSKEWTNRASWLENSPQAKLEYYNPLVMSKMFMMRDAARHNYWNTTHFVFLDAKHNCQSPSVMTPKNDHIIRAHMFDKLLMTTFDYTPQNEVHGFDYKAFNAYCNKRNPNDRQVVRVGRGGIFGGSGFVLEYITAMYDVALTATLREGLMGTEENIFSIVLTNVKQYVDEFSNNWACRKELSGDHYCSETKGSGYNCAIFNWVADQAYVDS